MWLKTSMKLNIFYLEKAWCGMNVKQIACNSCPFGEGSSIQVSIPKPATKTELTVARVWERKCTGSKLPCSSLKHRERLAASISGVGLSRTCLHHCKGLRDFSDDVNVFEEPTYNLKKRNLHYRYYMGI